MKTAVALLSALILTAAASAADPVTRPKAVLLIRHAEKPDDEDDFHLSPQGRKRAEALPELFRRTAGRLPTPDFIFAAKRSKHSDRSAETVAPLAKALRLEADATFENDDHKKLAKRLLSDPKYAGKTVLVCWHHGKLPYLAADLGAADAPDHWKDEVFDRVWVITYGPTGKARPLEKRRQGLLPGDEK